MDFASVIVERAESTSATSEEERENLRKTRTLTKKNRESLWVCEAVVS